MDEELIKVVIPFDLEPLVEAPELFGVIIDAIMGRDETCLMDLLDAYVEDLEGVEKAILYDRLYDSVTDSFHDVKVVMDDLKPYLETGVITTVTPLGRDTVVEILKDVLDEE